MPKSTTKPLRPKYRKLTIEVEESVAARLDAYVGTRARYEDAGAVAAAVVTDYLAFFEEFETEMAAFRARQRRQKLRELKRQ